MKTKLFLFCVASLLICMGCQKESALPQEPETSGVAAAAGKCDPNCSECQRAGGACKCLFCNCTRYCGVCGNTTYPVNRCVCNSGGNPGGGSSDCTTKCSYCKNPKCYCFCNPNQNYPVEHMQPSHFSTLGGGGSQQAAFQVVLAYSRYGTNGWPGYDTRGTYIIYDGDRFDRSASNLARLSIEDRLKRFKMPIVAKVRCVPQDADHMYNGLEYYVVITGTGGPDTYYTYMDLKIENPSFRDLACDTQRNRFRFEGSDKPLRNPNGAYGACAYIVTEVF